MRRRGWGVVALAASLAAGYAGVAAGHTIVAKARGGERASTVARGTIVVRGASGRVVARRAFTAALAPGGGDALAKLFAHQYTLGAWALQAGNFGILVSGPCTNAVVPNLGSPCVLAQPAWASGPAAVQKALTVSATDVGPNRNKLVLSGTFEAQNAGGISALRALVEVSCAGCPTSTPTIVEAPVSPSIVAAAGQKILISLAVGLQ